MAVKADTEVLFESPRPTIGCGGENTRKLTDKFQAKWGKVDEGRKRAVKRDEILMREDREP